MISPALTFEDSFAGFALTRIRVTPDFSRERFTAFGREAIYLSTRIDSISSATQAVKNGIYTTPLTIVRAVLRPHSLIATLGALMV